MGRVLIIAIAALVGAIGTWFLVPTVQREPVNKDMPVFTYDVDRPERPDAIDPPNSIMSSEDRHERAERLIGKPLKYITPDAIRTEAWYTEQGRSVIERSMDECYLLLEYRRSAYRGAPADERPTEEMADFVIDDRHQAPRDGGWPDELLTIPAATRIFDFISRSSR